ncbi:hypothetical protein BAE44_0024668 [Dichanthelium oligosanthes]|uniref:F-box associated domain-containing protein n=1 Tax=Dichanthelium oligosanthes TaxID=888268 RepID=A0A1E5UN48_9POAL|nr:hypothetical protein BAE44_0024668 [Dichanthelium oligosanthes]
MFLAACRRVCRELRRAVGDGGLLLPRLLRARDLLQLQRAPALPPAGAAAAGGEPRQSRRRRVPIHAARSHGRWSRSYRTIKDHCNGLFIYEENSTYYVCNPATRRWTRLPPRMEKGNYAAAYLVFRPHHVAGLRSGPAAMGTRCMPRVGIGQSGRKR